jgi:hypothetical protein
VTNDKLEALEPFREDGTDEVLTTNHGTRINDNQNSLKAGARGPSLLEDFILREKITHFDHERIPEQVVHARGAAAHGYFQVYKPLSGATSAAPLLRRDPSWTLRWSCRRLGRLEQPPLVWLSSCRAQRADVENRVKELKEGLAVDRLSCSRFLSNQFRLLLTAAAYILVQAPRLHAAGPAWATAQATTLRERVLKGAVWVERSVQGRCA